MERVHLAPSTSAGLVYSFMACCSATTPHPQMPMGRTCLRTGANLGPEGSYLEGDKAGYL